MTKLVSFYSKKGGVGKTTLAVNFAYYLLSEGHSVEFIDLDPQQSAKMFFPNNHEKLHYSTSLRHTLKADFSVVDYPPGATLEHNVKGYPILIANPTKLSIKDTYIAINNDEFARYSIIINRVQTQIRDNNAILTELVELIKRKNAEGKTVCNMLNTVALRAGLQSAENMNKSIFNLDSDERAKVSDLKALRENLTTIFEKIVKYC